MKMCVNETSSRVGKHLSDMFPINYGLQEGGVLLPLLFNYALEYAIRRIHVNQDGLKLNGTYQVLVCADVIYVLGESVHNIKSNTEMFSGCQQGDWIGGK
jgi:hypothetical protein